MPTVVRQESSEHSLHSSRFACARTPGAFHTFYTSADNCLPHSLAFTTIQCKQNRPPSLHHGGSRMSLSEPPSARYSSCLLVTKPRLPPSRSPSTVSGRMTIVVFDGYGKGGQTVRPDTRTAVSKVEPDAGHLHYVSLWSTRGGRC